MQSATQETLFRTIATLCDKAGKEAATATTPEPMVVVGNGERYVVPEGLCGFAEIRFAGNTAWGRWAKKAKLAEKCYSGGLSIWVSQYGQSYELKSAYAHGFAKKLREYNIDCYATARLD